ncbi:hypothetical protein CKAH01_09152 [Colletotrichum kahawae]|uniref:Uncharacterized protein n=1 Tax=Colletotrichum kahawae TaxID=34407 RepID=A0AAD9Y0V5_COLKA|nr:hypothetical protein CKAH01_09152 [Colletotrichum kahawae]
MNPHASRFTRPTLYQRLFQALCWCPAGLSTPFRDPLLLAKHHIWAKPCSLARGIAIISQHHLPTPPANRANDSIKTVTFPVPQDPSCDPG